MSKRLGYLSDVRLRIEALETRRLLSADSLVEAFAPVREAEPNNTLDAPNELGDLTGLGAVRVDGAIAANSADVDWYRFSLNGPAEVMLSGLPQQLGAAAPTLTLYNAAPLDFMDSLNPIGPRILAQSAASDLSATSQLQRALAAGTYYVAVSGAGNRDFHPFLADSGLAGPGGGYELEVISTSLDPVPGDAPAVLAVDASSLVVRVDLNQPLGFSPTVELTDSAGAPLNVAWANLGVNGTEVQIAPSRPLAAGTYHVHVRNERGQTVLSTAAQVAPTGDDADAGSNDTPSTARDLGGLASGQLVQVAGMIGDDPYYDSANGDLAFSPGNDVDLYHFRITGAGRYGLTAEVFAGRIGSPLDAGVSLYKMDPQTHQLVLVDGSNQSFNAARSTNAMEPLFSDPVFSAGLTAGDYYVAVAGGANTPAPLEGQGPGPDSGIFNPQVAHSGLNGWSVGPYVLNLYVAEDEQPPEVTATSLPPGATLAGPPTTFTVDFSEQVNLNRLAFEAYQHSNRNTVSAVYIQDQAGTKYFPRLDSYNPATGRAQFLMLDRLAPGNYELHVSGPAGIVDVAGNRLSGNDPSGDHVISFQVADSAPADSDNGVRDLGVLFPHELQAGVVVSNVGGSAANEFSFTVLQSQSYIIAVEDAGLGGPDNLGIQLADSSGRPISGAVSDNGRLMLAQLAAGVYTVRIGDGLGATPHYDLRLALLGAGDHAPPLLSGPAPAVQIRLDGSSTTSVPPQTPQTPQVALPSSPTGQFGNVSAMISVPGFTDDAAPTGVRHAAWRSSGAGLGRVLRFAMDETSDSASGEPVGPEVPAAAPPLRIAKVFGILDGFKDGPVGPAASFSTAQPGAASDGLAPRILEELFAADMALVSTPTTKPVVEGTAIPMAAAPAASVGEAEAETEVELGSGPTWLPWSTAVLAGMAFVQWWTRGKRGPQVAAAESVPQLPERAMIPLQDLEDLWQWSRRLQATHVEADEACLCNTVRDAAPQPHEEALAAAFSIWD